VEIHLRSIILQQYSGFSFETEYSIPAVSISSLILTYRLLILPAGRSIRDWSETAKNASYEWSGVSITTHIHWNAPILTYLVCAVAPLYVLL
jgi:hypothetical protein